MEKQLCYEKVTVIT